MGDGRGEGVLFLCFVFCSFVFNMGDYEGLTFLLVI